MFCSKCGKEIDITSKFCNFCGQQLRIIKKDNQGKKQIKTSIITNINNEKLDLFYIPTFQLFLLNFFTAGLYQLYWFVQNWMAIEKYDKKKISPFWRAVFAVFFCYELFSRVLKEAKSRGYSESYSPGFLTFLFIAFLLLGRVVSSSSEDIPVIIWLIIFMIDVIPFWIVQKASNYYVSKTNGNEAVQKKFHGGEVVLIVVGFILFSLAWIGILASG